MKVIGVIPARFAATRFPGKPLVDFGGKPMIQHVYERARRAGCLEEVLVATDDARIAAVVEAFGGRARMTARHHRSGTDRIAEVARDLGGDLIVNIQGDEPLLEPAVIELAVEPFRADGALLMGTAGSALEPGEREDPNVVKVVVDRQGFALYFSRGAIPYIRAEGQALSPQPSVPQGRLAHPRSMKMAPAGAPPLTPPSPPSGGRGDGEGGAGPDAPAIFRAAISELPVYRHIGLYVYRRDFLLEFAAWAPTALEQAEGLEQLRALEHGVRIRVVPTTYRAVGVDTPEDAERVRALLAATG